jgi:hypothetical protein
LKQETRLNLIKYHRFLRHSRIDYDDLGLYKELLDLIEAKAWRVNELVILSIHLAKVTEYVIEVLAIDILPPISNRRHNHVQEIRTSALGKMADSNLVDLFDRFNSRLKEDHGSKTRERKKSDTKDRSFDVARALHLLRCSTVGAFAFCRMDLLFQIVG